MKKIFLLVFFISTTAFASQDEYQYWDRIGFEKSLPYELGKVRVNTRIDVSRGYSHKATVVISHIEIGGVEVSIPDHVIDQYPLISPSSIQLLTSHIDEDSSMPEILVTIRFEYFADTCKHAGAISFLNYEFASHSVSRALECS